MNKLYSFLFLLVFSTPALRAQTNSDTLVRHNMVFELKNDTLYATTGLKIFVGQQLTIGNAAGAEGYYRSIISRKTAIVPSIWGQDRRYDYAIENHVNRKKNRELVKKSMIPGNIVTIKRIGLWKNSKPNFYIVALDSGDDIFSCDIKFALILNELLLQP